MSELVLNARRGSSIYSGVRWHERNGKWEARIFDSASAKQARSLFLLPPLSPIPPLIQTEPAATCSPAADEHAL